MSVIKILIDKAGDTGGVPGSDTPGRDAQPVGSTGDPFRLVLDNLKRIADEHAEIQDVEEKTNQMIADVEALRAKAMGTPGMAPEDKQSRLSEYPHRK